MSAEPHASGRKKKPKPVVYEPGYFTALMQQHDWPPRFQAFSGGPARPGRNTITGPDCRAPGRGFDAAPLGLQGARQYVANWIAHEVAKSRR